MKKALIFTGLKIAEISGVCLFMTLCSFIGAIAEPTYGFWLGMVPGFCILVLGAACLYGIFLFCIHVIPRIIKKNLEWADKLSKR